MNSTTFFLSKTMYVTLVRISMVHVQQEKFKLHWSQCPLVSWIKIWDDYICGICGSENTNEGYLQPSSLLSFCSSIERHLNASPNNRSIHISNHSRFSGSKQMLDAQLAAIKRSGNNNKCTTQSCHWSGRPPKA